MYHNQRGDRPDRIARGNRLLGTVLGMIKSFINISTGGFEGARQMKLAEGVSEALITTAAGLMVGIPALVFYSIFRGRVQKYIAELEAAGRDASAALAAAAMAVRDILARDDV